MNFDGLTKEETVRSLFALVALLIVSFVFVSPAQSRDWTGTQMMVGYTGRIDLTEENGWDVNGLVSVTRFWVPSDQSSMWFGYGGLDLAKGNLWLNPLVGYTDWFGEDDAVIAALWAGHSYGRIDYDLDVEWISTLQGQSAFYGFYSLGLNSGPLRTEIHAEQVDDLFQYGPGFQIKLNGGASFKVRYFNGQAGQTIRLQIGF